MYRVPIARVFCIGNTRFGFSQLIKVLPSLAAEEGKAEKGKTEEGKAEEG